MHCYYLRSHFTRHISHFFVVLSIAADEFRLGEAKEIAYSVLLDVGIDGMEGCAIEEAAIGQGGHMRSVSGQQPHNMCLLSAALVPEIDTYFGRIVEHLGTGETCVFRVRDLENPLRFTLQLPEYDLTYCQVIVEVALLSGARPDPELRIVACRWVSVKVQHRAATNSALWLAGRI